MRRKLKTNLGFYAPSFMHMHVGTRKNLLNLHTLNDEEAECIYMHEYVHFLQDITTTFGLANINVIADYLRYVDNKLITQPLGGFAVPVAPEDGNPLGLDIILNLHRIYEGTGDEQSVRVKSVVMVNHSMTLPIGQRNVEVVEVTVYSDGKKREFDFGADCILESMAYIVETSCYDNIFASQDIPYKSAELIVQKVYPSLLHDRLNVLALCDVALLSFNPGPFFYRLLRKMSNERKKFGSPEEIYQYGIDAHQPFEFEGLHDLEAVFNFTKNHALSQIKKYFNDKHFDPVINWVQEIIVAGFRYRTANPYFFLDLARGGRISTNAEFTRLLNLIGSPLVSNDAGETTIIDPRGIKPANYVLVWALDQINSTFWGDQRSCDMIPLCHKSPDVKVDIRCLTGPWLRANDPPPYCPYTIVWRHWKLAGYYPNL